MFGLTEEEMDLYRDLAQDFAVEQLAQTIVKRSQIMTPVVLVGNERKPDMKFLQRMLTDFEVICTITTTNMAYDYAHLQCDSDMEEHEIINHLHKKYENYVVQQFIKYAVAFTSEIPSEIVGEIILELPYLYVSAISDDEFDEDEFLEQKLAAYNAYMDDNFSYSGDEDYDEDEDFLEDEDEEE